MADKPNKAAKKAAPRRRRVTFRIDDGHAEHVAVAGSFSDWDHKPIELKRDGDGSWMTSVLLLPGRYEYRFIVDGQWRDDPSCSERVLNSFGSQNCVVHVSGGASEASE